ncbi:hypothetical protein JTE90_001042 [Oedothorax gibbosus]|uniref:Major facilitator superfamily (MFS) profile domain-containing protein n=1 Tax=Oedothorax gibbosus TaxID=931172 RepID=A0AAV6UH14_9ARAC|nr:hypothetical protein JTE90_001042 [Oedothorax gibbosus]
MSVVGVGACYLSETIVMVTIFWGILLGLGSCLSTTPLPQLSNIYFRKHLTTSNGLSYAGAPLSGFIMPPLVGYMLSEHGLKGTYLLLAGFSLNAIPAAMLFKEPAYGLERKKSEHSKSEQPSKIGDTYKRRLSSSFDLNKTDFDNRILVELKAKAKDSVIYSNDEFSNTTITTRIKTTYQNSVTICDKLLPVSMLTETQKSGLILKADCLQYRVQHEIEANDKEKLKGYSLPWNHNKMSCTNINEENKVNHGDKKSKEKSLDAYEISKTKTIYHDSPSSKFANNELNSYVLENFKGEKEIYCMQSPNKNHTVLQTNSMKDLAVLLDIQFLILSFTAGIISLFCFVLPTILNDFSLDKGISITHSTYLLMAMSTTDVVARVGLGWVTDRKFMSAANFCALCFLVLAACFAAMALTNNLQILFVILSLMGLGTGAVVPLYVHFIKEYIKPTRQLMANSSIDIFSAPFLLSTSSLIGYSRDKLGSYEYFVYLMCIYHC